MRAGFYVLAGTKATAGIEPAFLSMLDLFYRLNYVALPYFPRVARAATSVTWNVSACR